MLYYGGIHCIDFVVNVNNFYNYLIEQVSMFLAFMFRTVSSLETQICRASAAK